MRIAPVPAWLGAVLPAVMVGWLAGCMPSSQFIPPDQQKPLDRRFVEFPAETEVRVIIDGLTNPAAIAFDNEGSLLVADGLDSDIRIFGYRRDGSRFDIYPKGTSLPFGRKPVNAPVGGMVAAHGRIFVTHRDAEGKGVVSAFDYDGTQSTIVADLPAQGDHSVTDIAVGPDGRLYFGVGSATNSAVVGLDNLPWLRRNPDTRDFPWSESGQVVLLGRRFDTVNPFSGLFGGTDISVTAPFQPFGKSTETRIPVPANGKPNAAIYSVDPTGGAVRVEASGIRNPAGLAFNEYGRLYISNQGMKLRGTRPVKDDPDVLLKMVHGQWYGWPDFSANLLPIREPRFQPPVELIIKTGYPDLSFLIDHGLSRLTPPTARQANLLSAEFPPLSGASKFDFVPQSGPLARLREGRNLAIVALSGDRAPFDTSGERLNGPVGYCLVQVNVDTGQVEPFVRNVRPGPMSRISRRAEGIERPVDVKFGPDGALYILDRGEMTMRGAQEVVSRGSGRVLRLAALPPREE